MERARGCESGGGWMREAAQGGNEGRGRTAEEEKKEAGGVAEGVRG